VAKKTVAKIKRPTKLRKNPSNEVTEKKTTEKPINNETTENKNLDKYYGKEKRKLNILLEPGFEWNKQECSSLDISQFSGSKNFSGDEGLQSAVSDMTKISEFFNYFIDNAILNHIVLCSNKKIMNLERTAAPTNINELRAFVGLLLLFG